MFYWFEWLKGTCPRSSNCSTKFWAVLWTNTERTKLPYFFCMETHFNHSLFRGSIGFLLHSGFAQPQVDDTKVMITGSSPVFSNSKLNSYSEFRASLPASKAVFLKFILPFPVSKVAGYSEESRRLIGYKFVFDRHSYRIGSLTGHNGLLRDFAGPLRFYFLSIGYKNKVRFR